MDEQIEIEVILDQTTVISTVEINPKLFHIENFMIQLIIQAHELLPKSFDLYICAMFEGYIKIDREHLGMTFYELGQKYRSNTEQIAIFLFTNEGSNTIGKYLHQILRKNPQVYLNRRPVSDEEEEKNSSP